MSLPEASDIGRVRSGQVRSVILFRVTSRIETQKIRFQLCMVCDNLRLRLAYQILHGTLRAAY